MEFDVSSKLIIPAKVVSKDDPIIPAIVHDRDKHAEEKDYLILYVWYDDDGETIKSFEEIVGRTRAYNFIRENIDIIDIHESKVLVEGVKLEDAITIYSFMLYAQSFFDNDFNIDDYNDKITDEDIGRSQIGMSQEVIDLWAATMTDTSREAYNSTYEDDVEFNEI